jgi:hypothetical protein
MEISKNFNDLELMSGTKNEIVEDLIKNSKNVYDTPSSFIKRKTDGNIKFEIYSNNLLNMNNNNTNNNTNSKKHLNNYYRSKSAKIEENITEKKIEVIYEDWIYKLTENNRLKKYWLVIIGRDIFYYKSEDKIELVGMHNLSGCFVKEIPEKRIEGKLFYSFAIIFSSRTRCYFCLQEQAVQSWIKNLKIAIGYQSFFDIYEMLDDIGEGRFGLVKLGKNKKTNEKVAIKIVKKNSMTINDMELVRSEIDILKLCKHQNIVRLLDHLENSEYIFIVMEYLEGVVLGEYFTKHKFDFKESNASWIMYQIGSGIKYLHEYGILHRDLKPENIMLLDNGNVPIIKIMDFGLSKILGPLEKTAEGFGTLSFVAPEVLVRQPYNKQIDIWSIGVILYYMLSGTLPFDDEDDNEELIAKRTVFVELQFPENNWSNRSLEVIDIISKCLIKDPNKRIGINEFMEHPWIKNYI